MSLGAGPGHDVFDGGDARIIDRGYRRYEGDRTGVRGAMAAVVRHSLQRSLGLRRTVWAKVFPIVAVALAYVPAIVFIGIIALFPRRDTVGLILPTYGDYYGFVISAIMLFTASVAPEVMCTDRRTGMLGVYLAAPLDRRTYLASKALAIAAAISLVCIGPPLLMLVANVLQSSGPEGIAGIAGTTFDVLATGVTLTLLFTGLTMGITSLTDRKWVASASIVLLYLISLSVAGSFEASGAPEGINGLAPTLLAVELAQRLHGEYSPIMYTVPNVTVWAWWAVWTFGGFGLAWYRLKSLPVTR
jgi:ABC-2 type transport system permease protein